MKILTGWGRYPKFKTNELTPKSEVELIDILKNNHDYIARGNGRSYGDSAINRNLTINMMAMNKFLKWNKENGELVAESGVLIAEIIEIFLPKGWFPFVTPGTKYITLGGAIACDVHGKNHHLEGSFGDYVNWIEITDSDNKIIRCSSEENPDLFKATIGGMGLTGVILRCSINLRKVESGWIKQTLIENNNLKETMHSFEKFKNITYSVAWIDCLAKGKSFGRSILMLGEHAKYNEIKAKPSLFPKKRNNKINLFFDAPSFILNNYLVAIFNKIYFHINKRKAIHYIDWDSYFYPLDSIENWNKMYGKNGFFQFQCVLPNSKSIEGYQKILEIIQKESSGSFLAVLKQFGPGNEKHSFPQEGFTLALDFKVTEKNLNVSRKLTQIVNDCGGKIYLAKDAIMSKEDFKIQYPEEDKEIFLKHRISSINSEQSKRLSL